MELKTEEEEKKEKQSDIVEMLHQTVMVKDSLKIGHREQLMH